MRLTYTWLRKRGLTLIVRSGAAHETPRITGTGILRVKGPARRGFTIIVK